MQVEVDVNAWKPILVGMASPVLEILLLLKFGQISFSDHGLQYKGVKKFNQTELAEKIHASRC